MSAQIAVPASLEATVISARLNGAFLRASALFDFIHRRGDKTLAWDVQAC